MIIILETKGILDPEVIENLARRVKGKQDDFSSSLPVITCAASMAHHGLLGSVENMRLYHVVLTSVPAEHLASLASSVTEHVHIENVHGGGLVNFLDGVKSKVLNIEELSLGSEETRSLVQAMESHVEEVELGGVRGVTLNIRVLMEYNGLGKCREMRFDGRWTKDRYREQLKTWVKSRNWRVTRDDNYFIIERRP